MDIVFLSDWRVSRLSPKIYQTRDWYFADAGISRSHCDLTRCRENIEMPDEIIKIDNENMQFPERGYTQHMIIVSTTTA